MIDEIQTAWDEIAVGYDTHVTASRHWALPEEVLRVVDLQDGMRFLDVASGSGALSLPAARMGADVLAVDLSPKMIDLLLARARSEGLSNVRGRVMDGHDLELEDETFDVSGSQFGVMLFPDLPRALRELVRVTRRGGRVLMVAYGPPQRVEFLTFFISAMRAVVPGFSGLPEDPPPLPFQVADPAVLRRKMVEAGLVEVRVEAANERLEFDSGRSMWDWVVNSNPIARTMVNGLTEQQSGEVQQVLDGMLRDRSNGAGPAMLDQAVNIGIGARPASD